MQKKVEAIEKQQNTFNGINEKQVRTWRKSKEELSNTKKTAKRFKGAGGKVKDPVLDQELINWVRENRKEGHAISGKDLTVEARRRSTNPDFKASAGWLTSFKIRHTLSTRQRTSIGQKLPADYEEKLTSFHTFVIKMRKRHQYSLKDIYNMDETPLKFDMPSTRTLHDTGDKTVHIKTTNSEKRGFTAVLTVCADGSRLRPWIIYKGVRDPKIKIPGVYVNMQKKGYIDEEGCLNWIRTNFPLRSKEEPRRLLVWDSCATHLTGKVRAELDKRNIDVAVIPGGLTSLVQPLDVAVNKPMKDNMKKLWSTWMESGKGDYNNQGKRKPPTKEQVTTWVGEAWDDIDPEIITNGFLRCGISNKLDGTQDHFLYEGLVKFSEEEQGDSEDDDEVLKDLFLSDEEEDFNGF